MRQIAVSAPRTRVAEDVRASLTALGKGDADVGGVALVGLPIPGTAEVLDAVVLGPAGVTVIAGVDLPGPTMHLDAPLHGQWKTDNWPLVGDDDSINPGVGPLATALRLARLITENAELTVNVVTVLAVGPYVDRVSNGPTPADAVAVTYPTAPSLRTAMIELLGTGRPPCSVERARAVLHAITNQPPVLRDAELVAEGFRAGSTAARPPVTAPATPQSQPQPRTAGTAAHAASTAAVAGRPDVQSSPESLATPAASDVAADPAAADEPDTESHPPPPSTPTAPPANEPASQPTTSHPTATSPDVPPTPQTPDGASDDDHPDRPRHPARSTAAPSGERPARRRVSPAVPITTALVVIIAVVVLVVTLTGSADSTDDAQPTPQQPQPSRAQVSVADTDFTVIATATSEECADATVGEVQATVIAAGCTAVRQGSYLTTGRPQAAVTVAEFDVHDAGQAAEVHHAAETPGGGAATDIATQQQQWPETPDFDDAAYVAATEGNTVRLARATWTQRESTPDDAELRHVAETGLDIPLPS